MDAELDQPDGLQEMSKQKHGKAQSLFNSARLRKSKESAPAQAVDLNLDSSRASVHHQQFHPSLHHLRRPDESNEETSGLPDEENDQDRDTGGNDAAEDPQEARAQPKNKRGAANANRKQPMNANMQSAKQLASYFDHHPGGQPDGEEEE